MSRKTRTAPQRPQQSKAYVQAMQGLRRSSAAEPHRNKARYNRTAKYRTDYRNEA